MQKNVVTTRIHDDVMWRYLQRTIVLVCVAFVACVTTELNDTHSDCNL